MLRSGKISQREIVLASILFLLTLFIIYPLLHKFGHAVAAWLCGMKVESIQVFPDFVTIVSIEGESAWLYFFIASMGWLMPLLISLIQPKTLPEAAMIISLRVMVMVTAIGEMVSIGEYAMGHADAKSDMTNVLVTTNASMGAVLFALMIITATAAALFAKGIIHTGNAVLEEAVSLYPNVYQKTEIRDKENARCSQNNSN